ncbi:MAG TPA: hypothetical protein VMA30_14275 [Xanthobacteraceae bacterium]|nr:hypothetical protein [Xanthobacteraceae bacterium]
MDSIIQYVVGELKHIARFPVAFVAAVLVMVAGAWWAMDWRYSGVIANLHSDLDTARNQRDNYKDKLSGETTEAKPERHLTDDQKLKFTAVLGPLVKEIGTVTVVAEPASEPMRYSRQFTILFKQIGINAVGPFVGFAQSAKDDKGVFVGLLDPDKPSDVASKFYKALNTVMEVKKTKLETDPATMPTSLVGRDFDLFVGGY